MSKKEPNWLSTIGSLSSANTILSGGFDEELVKIGERIARAEPAYRKAEMGRQLKSTSKADSQGKSERMFKIETMLDNLISSSTSELEGNFSTNNIGTVMADNEIPNIDYVMSEPMLNGLSQNRTAFITNSTPYLQIPMSEQQSTLSSIVNVEYLNDSVENDVETSAYLQAASGDYCTDEDARSDDTVLSLEAFCSEKSIKQLKLLGERLLLYGEKLCRIGKKLQKLEQSRRIKIGTIRQLGGTLASLSNRLEGAGKLLRVFDESKEEI
ncbi:unnamed protein product [Dimorphilus gyrociliatus]|uniref:Uncharacterized protein n=1 Tax=Dimorphilus gyrociliatus TaxID=2664684 RepID=A0A7I8VKZ4_9ANNE|nr:unnamed protein product [Dimorphilus gyrociliatus]